MNLTRLRARLNGQEYTHETFTRQDLRNAVAQGSRFHECTFEGVRMDGSALGDATFDGCTFRRCSFRHATLVSRLYRCTFELCDFDQAIFQGADVRDCSFIRCRAQYSDWTRSTVARTRFDVDFRGAHLNFGLTEAVDFTGSNLWSALIPFNCAMIHGNKFDERTIQSLVALLQYASGPKELLWKLNLGTTFKIRKLVERLVKSERGEPVVE